MRSLKHMLADLEKDIIAEGLKRTHWNKSRLAKELGISRSNLINKVKMYNLERRNLARRFETSGTDDEATASSDFPLA